MRSDETLEKNTEHSQSIITSIWSKYIFTVAKMLQVTCVDRWDSYFTNILVLYYLYDILLYHKKYVK